MVNSVAAAEDIAVAADMEAEVVAAGGNPVSLDLFRSTLIWIYWYIKYFYSLRRHIKFLVLHIRNIPQQGILAVNFLNQKKSLENLVYLEIFKIIQQTFFFVFRRRGWRRLVVKITKATNAAKHVLWTTHLHFITHLIFQNEIIFVHMYIESRFFINNKLKKKSASHWYLKSPN